MKYRLFIFFLLYFTVVCANAQYSRLFTVENGLSSTLINNLYQDSRGNIWISTGYGLNKYDGAKFVKYISEVSDSTTLLSNNVYYVFENADSLFVLSTGGLQVYDYSTDSFRTLLYSGNGYNNKCIIKRKDGTILIGTSGYGIKILDITPDGEVHALDFKEKYKDYYINSIVEDNSGNLWIGTEYNGLICIDSKNNETCYKQICGENINSVNICSLDSIGNVYISSVANGVYVYDKDNTAFKKIYSTNYPLTSIVQRGDIMLLGTDGDGIISYDTISGKISKAEMLISEMDISSSKVHSIVIDNYDNMWVGVLQKGVVFFPAKTNKFGYIGCRSTLKNSIGDKCITSICDDGKGNFIVGTDNDGIYVLDSYYNQISHLSPRSSSLNAPYTVMCMYRDSRDRVWVGSYLKGLSYLSENSFNYISFEKYGFHNADRIYSIVEDDNERLWIGTMGSGLYYIDLNSSLKVNDILYTEGRKLSVNDGTNQWISSLYYSTSGYLYIGTVDGARCLDLKKGEYITHSSVLTGNSVNSINQDSDGNVWIGTIDGIRVFDCNLSSLVCSYSTEDGLPSNNIASIVNDALGNIWVSTNLGIAKFDSKTGKFNSFRNSDGLYNNEFSKGASYYDGCNIYFGGTNGIVYFHPDDIRMVSFESKIRFTDFYLNGEAINSKTKSGRYNVLKKNNINDSYIELAYNDNSFTIEFASDNYAIPHNFEYSMNNGPWNSLQPGTSRVSFSNLPVGKYSFNVRNKSEGIVSSSNILYITIHPAWYASFVAKLIYLLLFVSLVLFVLHQIKLRYLANKKMLEHKLREDANEAKLQFFINIAHEIRTPMSLIISPLHRLISSDGDYHRQKDYSIMERNAERILTLVNQLMDARKIEKGQMKLMFSEIDLVSYIRDTVDIFSYQAGIKGVKLNILPEKERLNAWIDPNNFDKIILNLLSNSFKHVPENGVINVYISTGNDIDTIPPLDKYIEITVEDNGTGIEENEIGHIFERFYQIAADDSGKNGTGIGLHLAMSLTKLHHGSLTVKNNTPLPGCSFTLRIPLGRLHLKDEEIVDNRSQYLLKKSLQPTSVHTLVENNTPDINKQQNRKKYTILIADDDNEITDYLAKCFDSSYRVIICRDGKEAIDTISSSLPDIVLTDVMMPRMDGISLLKKIKQNIHTNHIPVVLLTALNSDEDNIEGLSSGADAYLTKPFNIDIVTTTIDNLLKGREILKNNFSGNQEQEHNMVYIKPESADDKLMKKVMSAINRNIGNPDLNVEMIANEVGISRVHLYRKLKELTNQSTRDFIRNTRLKQAEALLMSDKDYNISEIALLVGFSNTTYFSNSFKDLYGMSPSKYVELHKTNGKV